MIAVIKEGDLHFDNVVDREKCLAFYFSDGVTLRNFTAEETDISADIKHYYITHTHLLVCHFHATFKELLIRVAKATH